MIVDASAILAILLDEPEAPEFVKAIASSPFRRLSPVNYVEIVARLGRPGMDPDLLRLDLPQLIAASGIQIVAITPRQAELAAEAYLHFGKSRHAAQLNLGDCFAYALAKEAGEPLLYKGEDFAQTDIEAA